LNLRLSSIVFLLAVLVGLRGAHGQTASGSGLPSGSYVFREFDMSISQMAASAPTYALSGTIVFNSGSGSYTVTGTKTTRTLTTIQTVPFSASNSWSCGQGRISITDPLSGVETIAGVVSQGVIVASAPDPLLPGSDLNIFIAIPMGSLNNASFTSDYQTAVLDFSGEIKNAFFTVSPDGKGGLGTITLNGQETNAPGFVAVKVTQSVSGASYSFNGDGSATLTVPTNPLFTGTKTVFASPDGNFILGWTPGGLDIFFGVKALAAGTGTNGISQGIYFTAGFDVAGMLQKRPLASPDFYFGTYSMTGDANGDALVQQVTNLPLGGVTAITWDFATDDQIVVNPDGTAGPDALGYSYAFGAGGNGFVAIGTQGIFGLVVGVRAAAPAAVAGVYVNRATVVNAASYQPVIAGVAPGELITLFGSGLASTTMAAAGGGPVPLSLGGVSATLNGIPCPVFAVSPSQISILVPHGVAPYGADYIQVTNNGVASNVVSVGSGVNFSQPGVFSQSQDGIGFAAARHAATEELVDQANPAQPGEYISIYMTGLGTVTPAIADGSVGPSNPLSTADCWTNGSMSVVFNDYGPGAPSESDVLGAIQFAGLAPGLAGLYQVNVLVPTKGLMLGDLVEIELQINHERFQPVDIRQVYIPYGPGAAAVPR
jgi:uncharacterized protein (TIGR03437 family)